MSAQPLPLTDRRGDRLVALEHVSEVAIAATAEPPCPLALVVVTTAEGTLFGKNRWRKVWELPGGMIEDGETPRVAGSRELAEETGVEVAPEDLVFVGAATFELVEPVRTERAAIYRVRLDAAAPAPSYELVEVGWANPAAPGAEVHPLDAAIAAWAAG